jgi:Zn-dependent peptidase ImmA (M78 family)
MKIKQHIKIGYRDIEIKISNPDFITDNLTDCFGQYDNRKGVIEIQKNLPAQKLVNTLLHEIGHVVVDISGLNQSGAPLEKDDDEEIVVHQFANYFLAMCKDNPWFLNYIKENI